MKRNRNEVRYKVEFEIIDEVKDFKSVGIIEKLMILYLDNILSKKELRTLKVTELSTPGNMEIGKKGEQR